MSRPVALVTGASSGLGRALAIELAKQGYAVGITARREDLLRQLLDELTAAGQVSAMAMVDVGDPTAMVEAVSRIELALGPIDLVIANAGIGLYDKLDPFDVAIVERTFRVNLMGVVNTIGAVLPGMLARGSGHIVGISSLGADRGLPGSAAYTASKAALNTHLEGIRIALKPRGVAVTTVCPGFIRTDMTAQNEFSMPGVLEPEEAARRIVRRLKKRPAVYRFPLGMSLLMRTLRHLPDWVVARLVPTGSPPNGSSRRL